MKRALFIKISILMLFVSSTAFSAEIKRDILAVADGGTISTENDDLIFKKAQLVLEHLGFRVRYADISTGLPSDEEMQKYVGVITWFTKNHVGGAVNYAKWLTRQLDNGKKLVVLGFLGFELDEKLKPIPKDVFSDFLRAFKISFDPADETDNSLILEALYKDKSVIDFERKIEKDIPYYNNLNVLDPHAKIFLKIRRKDTGKTADVVFVHSKGGMILRGYDTYQNEANFQTRWWIDPFKFFALAFNADFPKPDISTENGTRIFYSHVDGDGLENKSNIDKGKYSSELAYEMILAKYNLPVTVSVIIGSIETYLGREHTRLKNISKKIFELPNVEPASHGWLHPFVWRENGRKMAFKSLTRSYSPESEIKGSIDYINKELAPKGKETDVFLWTGDCRPDYEALKFVADNKILAMNGGDTRFDSAYPSYNYVSPNFRHVGDLLQNFTSMANDDIYTNLLEGPLYGFKYVLDTFKNTGSPVRIRPVNIYFHFYSMDNKILASALEYVFDWAKKEDLSPMFLSEYIKILNGSLSAKIDKAGENRWVIENNGELRTFRFDNYSGAVDLARSKGVLGFNRFQGALYVHLDNGERSEIVLGNNAPSMSYLVKANGRVKDWKIENGNISFKLRAMNRVHFVLHGGASGNSYSVKVGTDKFNVTSDKNGDVSFDKPLDGSEFKWLDVSVK